MAIRFNENQGCSSDSELHRKIGTHVFFAGWSFTELFAKLDEDVNLFRTDALDCLFVVFREVILVQDVSFCQSFNVGLLGGHSSSPLRIVYDSRSTIEAAKSRLCGQEIVKLEVRPLYTPSGYQWR
jgi:hypothetical protein